MKAWLLGKDVDPHEREELARQVEKELLDLNEGNIEYIGISRNNFDQREAAWKD